MDVDRRTLLAGAAPALASTQAIASPLGASSPRREIRVERGWRFALGHAQDPARDFGFGADQGLFAKAGASRYSAAPTLAGFDDTGWEPVRIPHDWAVALPFVPPDGGAAAAAGEDDPRAAHGYKPLGREFPGTSVGWYRAPLRVEAADRGRRHALRFDGVFREAQVFVNGWLLARHADGYTPFEVDISDVVDFAGPNLLAVRVDASQGEGWFYEGAGVYRHVWSVVHDPVHVPSGGVFVRSAVCADGSRATLRIGTEVSLHQDAATSAQVASTVLDAAGRTVAGPVETVLALQPWVADAVEQTLEIARPALWSVDQPYLHRLISEVRVEGRTVDRRETAFGVREARFDPDRGFLLNGRPLKLKGTCNHQDHAGVGVALPDRLHAFRIERLKAMGSNAYRAAHNPPAPELLDACDRMGMLVIDETRRMSSDAESLGDLRAMVRRDRNHPCVIAWSIGNEEPQQSTERGARIAATMKREVLALDDTRPVTEALDKGWGEGVTAVIDVMGFNYRTTQIDAFHARFPKMPVMGTETASTVTTRGVYVRDAARRLTTAYDAEAPWWATTAEGWWPYVAERDYIAGGFVWTGFDYRGEPTPFGRWPSVASYFGVLDTCGFEKDEFFYYKAWWDEAPLLHLFPHWTWPGREGQPIEVWAHTNLDRAELLVNGASAGVRVVERGRHVAWSVPYAPGAIEARGWRGDRMVRVRRETAGPPARLALIPDRPRIQADGRDLAIVKVEVRDVLGRLVPQSDAALRFSVTGPGRLIGVGNGDPTSHEFDLATTRRAFNGLAMALVQSDGGAGAIRVKADAESGSGETVIEALRPPRSA